MNTNETPSALPRKGWKTYTIGSIIGAIGAVLAFISGVDWSVFFTPEAAVVLGTGVAFGRAIVAFFQSRSR